MKPSEGVESEKEPETTGPLTWRFSKRLDSGIYSVKFSSDEAYIAVATGDSSIAVFSTKSNAKELDLKPVNAGLTVPCTSIAFRPDNAAFKNKYIVGAAYADGTVRHWHCTTGQLLSTINEKDNQINSFAYQKDGSSFVTAGNDLTLRIYDAEYQKITLSLSSG